MGGTRKGALVVPIEDWNWESRMKAFRSDKFTEVEAEVFASVITSDNDQKKRKHEPDASSEVGLTPKARKEGTYLSSPRVVEKCGTESMCSATVSSLGVKKNYTPSRKVITPRRRISAKTPSSSNHQPKLSQQLISQLFKNNVGGIEKLDI